MKICFIIPDGTGIRNYLYSKLVSELPQGTEILLWHNISPNAISEVKSLHNEVAVQEEKIPVYVERFRERVLREATTFARLRLSARTFDNETIVSNWYKPRKTMKRKMLFKAAEWLGSWAEKDYGKIRRLENRYTGFITKEAQLFPYEQFLKKHKPDLVFCTHQRVPWLVPAIEAAKKLGIKTATAIYSWDNIPKARLPLRTDAYIVWSEYMKEELMRFYPEIEAREIMVTGSPQFEFYRDPSRIWSREDFAERFHLDPSKKIICYSGDDTDISPYDPLYLNDLAEALTTIEEKSRPHIIFRRSPADFTNRYDEVLKKHSELITSIDPLWRSDGKSEWNQFYPLPEDVDLLVNLAYHCSLAVNIASTIAHDFSAFNKPTCYMNYDQECSTGWTVKVVYRFEHFRSMKHLQAVEWINSKEEIRDRVVRALEHPSAVSEDRVKWFNTILIKDFEQSSAKIARLFTSLCYGDNDKKVALENFGNELLPVPEKPEECIPV